MRTVFGGCCFSLRAQMPRKNKRKFFKINKKGSGKANEAEGADSSRKNVQTLPEENSITPASTSVESAEAMGHHEVEISEGDTGSTSTSKLEVFTLKVIQFVGELPNTSQIDVDSDERLKIESHIEKPQSETIDAPKIESINEPHRSEETLENKHVARTKDRIFDANYRVESPQNLEGYRNKRHAVMIQEIVESSSTDNLVTENETSDVIDAKLTVEKTVAIPMSYRVDSPENYSDTQQQVVEHDGRITVQEIAESSSSESLKSESPKHEPKSEQNCLKIINIKELPSEDIVPSSEVREYECNYKIEKKSLPNRDAVADPHFSPMMCIPSPSRYLDVIAEESSDCSDIEKTTTPLKNIVEEELDDDVFLEGNSERPEIPRKPTSFRRRSHRQFFPEPQQVIIEQPILISTKIIETENVTESVNKWSTSTGESELTAELVYLNSTSSSCTDLDSRSERSDITDYEDDNSEDTETNTMLDNLVLEEIDHPIEIKMRQQNIAEVPERIPDIPENLQEIEIPETIEVITKDMEDDSNFNIGVEEVVQVDSQIAEVMQFMDKLAPPKLSFAPKIYDQESLDEVDEIEEIDEIQEIDQTPETLENLIMEDAPKNIENQFEDIEREFQSQMLDLKLENEQFRNKMQLQIIMDQEKIESTKEIEKFDESPGQSKKPEEEIVDQNPPEIPPRKQTLDKFEPIDIDLLIKIFEDQTLIEKAKRTKNLLSTIPVLEHQLQSKDKAQAPADKVYDYTKTTDKTADVKLDEIESGKPIEFPRKNSSDSSSSNSNCTIIRQFSNVSSIEVQPLKELCTDLIIKSGLQHESSSDDDLKCDMRRQKNAPKIPVIDEIEFSTRDTKSEGRTVDNKSITVLQSQPSSVSAKNSSEKEHWLGIQSMQIPNLLVALSPLQNDYMTKTTDQAADADSLLDMHKKFIERRAYHEQEIDDYYTKSASMTSTIYTGIDRHDQRRANSERISVEKSTPISAKKAKSSSPPAHERQFQIFHEAQGKPNNNLRLINIFDEPDSQLGNSEPPENISNFFAQYNQVSQISAIAADLSKQFVEAKSKACAAGDESFKNSSTTPMLELAKVDHKMRTIKNCILRDEFFRETFSQKSVAVPNKPQTGVIAQKKSELQEELKLLEEERKKIEDELNYIQSLQFFKNEEIRFNQQKMQITEHDKQVPTKLINHNQNPNEHLQREMHNEWQQQVMERNERKLQKLLKLTSVDSENNANSAEKPLEIVKIVPIENEFLKKVRERRKRLSIPADSDLNSSTESLHHQNQAKSKRPAKAEHKENLPIHLQEFIEFYDDTDKSGDKSGEFKDPFVIGLICCICVAGLCIGRYFLTRSH